MSTRHRENGEEDSWQVQTKAFVPTKNKEATIDVSSRKAARLLVLALSQAQPPSRARARARRPVRASGSASFLSFDRELSKRSTALSSSCEDMSYQSSNTSMVAKITG